MFQLLGRLWLDSLHIPPAPSLSQIGEFGVGVARGVEDALTPLGVGGMLPTPMDTSKSFELGRGLGQMWLGIAEMGAGAGGEVGATLLDATGLGALVGVPGNIVSAELILQGGAAAIVGAKNLGHAMSGMGGDPSGSHSLSTGGGGGRGPDLPDTPFDPSSPYAPRKAGGLEWTEPQTIAEQMALEEAKAGGGRLEMGHERIKDPKYRDPGWVKNRVEVERTADGNRIDLHYMYNTNTHQIDQVKFIQEGTYPIPPGGPTWRPGRR
jgi:hypothetical protein